MTKTGGLEDLVIFLKERELPDEFITKIKNDKIDCNVLPLLNENQMKNYIPAYGDRIAAVAFCKKSPKYGETRSNSMVIEQLKRKIEIKRGHLQGNKNARKDMKRMEIGWFHFDEVSQVYKQVKRQKGGGKRSVSICKEAKAADIIPVAKELFFPHGFSVNFGAVDDYTFCLKDFQLNEVGDLSVQEMLSIYRLTNLSVYLGSKRKEVSTTDYPAHAVAYTQSADKEQSGNAETSTVSSSQSLHTGIAEEPARNAETLTVSSLSQLLHTGIAEEPARNVETATVSSLSGSLHTGIAEEPARNAETIMTLTSPWEQRSVNPDSCAGEQSISEIPEESRSRDIAEDVGFVDADTPTVSFRQVHSSSTLTDVTPSNNQVEEEDVYCEDLPVIRRRNMRSLSLHRRGKSSQNEETNEDISIAADIEEAIRRSLQDNETGHSFEDILKNWIRNIKIDGLQQILVHRKRLLKSTLWAINHPNFSFITPLKVAFSGESGDDSGGPQRELFRKLMSEVENEISTGQDSNKVFKHDVQKIQEKMFLRAGQLVSWSVLHGGPGLPIFNQQLYDLITIGDCTNVDLEACDLDTRTALEDLINAQTDNQFQNVLQKHFDWLMEQGMVAYGQKIRNKDQIVKVLFKNAVFYRTHAEITQFTEGLNTVGNLFYYVKLHPVTMRRLIVNESSELSFDQFRSLYKINFSPQGANAREKEEDTIFTFESFIMDSAAGQSGVTLSDILAFWTGASSLPPLGFSQQLQINFVQGGPSRLPVGRTCGMVLELPRGASDQKLFAEQMLKAINWSGGFHLI